MIRLHALVEGQTEEAYFNRSIVQHLAENDVHADVRVVNQRTNSNSRKYKGGWNSFKSANADLLRWMKEDPTAWFTTMVDLYALPADFPRRLEAAEIKDPHERVEFLEAAWKASVCTDDLWRFIPYIQLHEFEALLLVEPQKLDWEFLEHAEAIKKLIQMASKEEPELINDGPKTAPSKRIISEIPEYADRKVSAGPLVADKIGLEKLRKSCGHFNKWLVSLEELSRSESLACLV